MSKRDWGKWVAAVERELMSLGMSMIDAKNAVSDNEDWFEREFDGGEFAEITAGEWFSNEEE